VTPWADIPEGFAPFPWRSPFLDLMGPLYEKRGRTGLTLGLRIDERHTNRRGVAHGGMLVTLADVLLGYGTSSSRDDPRGLITANLTADFAGVARLGDWVEGRTDVQRFGRSLAFANCYLQVGERRIVRVSGVFAVGRRPGPGGEEGS
jgi:acyl-coenzyme A thioesterase 13